MSEASILAQTARGAGWVMAWRMLTRVLGLISTLVLVRLLSPADFGLVALATAFALALDVCLSIGVEDQIVRSHDPRPALYDTAFTLNLIRSLLLAVLIALVAGPAAAFFDDARLRDVLWALALSAALSGLANIGVADFRRRLSFDKEFKLQLLPRLAGITVTLVGAWLLRSHWALVLGILTNRLGVVIMGHVLHPYRPRLSLAAWRELVGVSLWSWAISLAAVVRDRADSLVIGRTLGPASLGIYAVGVEVAVLPTTELVDPLCRACMPGFAATLRQGGNEELGEAFLRIIGITALLTLPAGVGISAVAGPAVALAFGQGWLAAVPVMAVLGAACTVMLFGNISWALLSARAALQGILAITAGSAILRVGLLLAMTAWLGLPGAACAVGLALVVEHLALLLYALRSLYLPVARLVPAVLRPALATLGMAAVLWLLGLGWATPPANGAEAGLLLLQAIPLGAACYGSALFLAWWVAGRPAGAEADLLATIRRVARPALARLSRPSVAIRNG